MYEDSISKNTGIIQDALKAELERLKKQKNSKRPHAPVDRETDDPIDHPAYYLQVPKDPTMVT